MDPEKDRTGICIDDSEIMRELQCVSQLRWERWSVYGVWANTEDRTQWEVSVLKLPRSVGSSRTECQWNAGRCYGLRWVCTYGTSHPGRWSALENIDRYCLRNVWVYGRLQQKYPG